MRAGCLGRRRGSRPRAAMVQVVLVVPSLVVLVVAPACGATAERSQASYCVELRRQSGKLQPAPEQALARVYGDAAEAFDEVRPTAPAEIRPDVEAVTKGLHQLAELTAEAEDGPVRADRRRLVEVALSLQTASDRVNAYNTERCGLDTAAATTP